MSSIEDKSVWLHAKQNGITHISTGVAILRNQKILMLRRAKDDFLGGHYELPGGGVDYGETIEAGAIREVYEETGLTVSKVLGMFEGFDYTTDKKPRVRQINVLVEVAGGDIALDPDEHDNFEWVDVKNYKNLEMSDNMRQCMQIAFQSAATLKN